MADEFKNPGDPKTSIRLATASDALPLAKLRFTFRSGLGRASESEAEFVERCEAWMRERLREGGRWRCWIAEQGQALVGNVWVQLIEKIPNPVAEAEYHAYVTNFYVRDEARGEGTGTMLLSGVLEWCKSRDVQAVLLWPTQRSRALYERQGFSIRTDILGLMMEAWGDAADEGEQATHPPPDSR
jgi:GNAT superfamily N-acetyltransferase